jgi:hypothetical protein
MVAPYVDAGVLAAAAEIGSMLAPMAGLSQPSLAAALPAEKQQSRR